VNDDCLKLTVYFGERARVDGRFVAERLIEIFARHELAASLVMRGVEGFGAKHGLRTDRLLTLSEDLPLVAVAVDVRARIEAARREVEAVPFSGLVTLEPARLLTRHHEPARPPPEVGPEAKLTVYVGRQDRVGRTPAYAAIVDRLHAGGVAGATVFLGVDGTAHGVRQRALFFARNAHVPMIVAAVGDGARIAGALPEISAMLDRPLVTLEPVEVCKRDGRRLAAPARLAPADPAVRQKLTVYAGEQSRHAGRPLSHALVRELRRAGAAGATSLRGVWGYHGDHPPHGDSFWALRRRVPLVTVIVDTPERMGGWWEIVDRLTDEAGLVTSETVPAHRVHEG
jgi:PII-like signaling protein